MPQAKLVETASLNSKPESRFYQSKVTHDVNSIYIHKKYDMIAA